MKPPAGAHTIVKVCGLTRLEDARFAMDAGADWLGFIVKAESPRTIAVKKAANIVTALPGVVAVAVMVDVTPEEAEAHARAMGAARVQLHRVNPATWPTSFPFPAAFAVPVAEDGALASVLPTHDHVVLLDTADPEKAGGTGRTLPWDDVAGIAAERLVMLAGGLDGDNVVRALDAVRPYGVDASSRLERSPGVKDAGRVRRYIEAVRKWEAS